MIIKYVLLNKLYEIKYLDNCIGLLVNEVLKDRENTLKTFFLVSLQELLFVCPLFCL